MMKRLTGMKWDPTEDVLAATYKSYVRPVLEYGSEAYHTACDSTKKQLSTVQNNALRLICRAAASTPVIALECQADVDSLEARRDKVMLKFCERSKDP